MKIQRNGRLMTEDEETQEWLNAPMGKPQIDQLQQCIKALETISRQLDNLEYKCSSSVYTLDDDEMSTVFFCRDLADSVLRELKKDK